MVSAECAPAAKAGGLGDAVYGLSRELEVRGHAVEMVLPKYASMRYDSIWGLEPAYHDLWVPWYGGGGHFPPGVGFVPGGGGVFFESPPRGKHFWRGRPRRR